MIDIKTYVVIKDNKFIAVYETDSIDGVVASLQYEGITDYDDIRMLPHGFEGKVGQNINEYDANNQLLPELDRMKAGYIDLPPNKKWNADQTALIDKTLKDKIDAGEIELTEYQKYDETTESIINKTAKELCSQGIITLAKFKDVKVDEIKLGFDNEFVNGHFLSQSLGIEVDYRRYDKKNDKQNVEALIAYMVEENIPEVIYKGYESLKASATIAQLQTLVKEMNAHGIFLYNKKDTLIQQIKDTDVINDIDQIKW